MRELRNRAWLRALPYLLVVLAAGGISLWYIDFEISDPNRAERMRAESRQISEDESQALETRAIERQRLRMMGDTEDKGEKIEAAGPTAVYGSAAVLFFSLSAAGVGLARLARAEREEARARG